MLFSYYIMPKYKFSLLEYIESGKTLTVQQNLNITIDLINTLKLLHSLGYCHRDIKLENIMLSDKPTEFVPIIIDFSLSKPFLDDN